MLEPEIMHKSQETQIGRVDEVSAPPRIKDLPISELLREHQPLKRSIRMYVVDLIFAAIIVIDSARRLAERYPLTLPLSEWGRSDLDAVAVINIIGLLTSALVVVIALCIGLIWNPKKRFAFFALLLIYPLAVLIPIQSTVNMEGKAPLTTSLVAVLTALLIVAFHPIAWIFSLVRGIVLSTANPVPRKPVR
jgi:hypothetical protein